MAVERDVVSRDERFCNPRFNFLLLNVNRNQVVYLGLLKHIPVLVIGGNDESSHSSSGAAAFD